jgi:hypothetical protein
MRKDPLILMRNVPSGNREVYMRETIVPIANRETAPNAPPSITKTYLVM